jgi:hypothetical protein
MYVCDVPSRIFTGKHWPPFWFMVGRNKWMLCPYSGIWWCKWSRHCATSWKVVGSFSDVGHEGFSWTWSFWPHYGPGINSSSNRNEYQDYLGGGGDSGQCIGLITLSSSCADCLEILKASVHTALCCIFSYYGIRRHKVVVKYSN